MRHSDFSILRDASKHPRLFVWFGRLASDAMSEWLHVCGLCTDGLPDDLLAVWRETGGGDFFETETLLGSCRLTA